MSKIYNLRVPHTEQATPPNKLRENLPLSPNSQSFIDRTRHEVRQILDGIDSRLLLIVGPCSIHDITAAKEYATKLQQLAQTVSDSFLILMRAHFEKPRTNLGWTGLVNDPHLNGSYDINTGLSVTRKLLLDLNQMEIPIACEILDPCMGEYLGDLISWGCIGARTAESQTHRQLASSLQSPIAFKNNTDGNVNIAIQGINVASNSHSYLGINDTGQSTIIRTKGNSHAHLVLRGADTHTNYDPASINSALEKLQLANQHPRLLIDCAHGNSEKLHEKQPKVFQSVINQIIEGNPSIRGLIFESFLESGNQKLSLSPLRYGVSITDPCLDWTTTEQLVIWAHHKIQQELVKECETVKIESEV